MKFDKLKRELFFTQQEYDMRLRKIREGMSKRGLDVLLLASPENLLYVTGYQTFGYHNFQLLVIPLEGSPFLVVRYMETMLAYTYGWLDEIVPVDEVDDPIDITLGQLKKRGLANLRVGAEERSFFFQVSTWKKLSAAIPTLTDGSGVVEVVRAIKSEKEIEYMREAARMTDLGITAAIAEVRPGRMDNDLAAAAFNAMTRAGAEYLIRDPIVTTGRRSGIPHSCYMRQALNDGDAILLEMSGVFHRYYAPMMRGAVVGKASPELKRIAAICIETLDATIKMIRPGRTFAEVDATARGVILRENMWDNYRKRTGYSIGVGMSSWSELAVGMLKEKDETELKPGMCFHMPIALRLYGEAGFGCSEFVVVTSTGCETFGNVPRVLTEC